ncbi:hypothetical protein [Mangrovimonas aestuarii]|uniref:hypothetical protein n=1 Tax=Mangrovimonas aestuarii TaxID=3018443 RepID=UPI00237918AA|nr:hypothetical protein [Mangrovimonas aestuarii]
MNVFESIKDTSNKAFEYSEIYIKTTERYYKLKAFQQLTISVSLISKMLLIGALIFIGFVFAAIALAIAIGYYLGNMALGCLIVGFLFVVIALLVYMLRHVIDHKIISIMSLKFFN